MRRVTLSGVPVHPALVHFPVVFWILVPLLDLGNGLDREGPYWRLGWFFAFAGVISPLPAIVAGALDAWACRNVAAAEKHAVASRRLDAVGLDAVCPRVSALLPERSGPSWIWREAIRSR